MHKSIATTNRHRHPPAMVALLFCLAIAASLRLPSGFGFGAIEMKTTKLGNSNSNKNYCRNHQHQPSIRSLLLTRRMARNALLLSRRGSSICHTKRTLVSIGAAGRDDEIDGEAPNKNEVSAVSEPKTAAAAPKDNNFDGEGFANYLLPYAAALIGSLLATAAVFKFVLLDY